MQFNYPLNLKYNQCDHILMNIIFIVNSPWMLQASSITSTISNSLHMNRIGNAFMDPCWFNQGNVQNISTFLSCCFSYNYSLHVELIDPNSNSPKWGSIGICK